MKAKFVLRFKSGTNYIGRTPGEVVDNLKNASPFTANQSRYSYMRGYSARYHKLFGRYLSTWSPMAFLVSLASTDEIESFSIMKGDNDDSKLIRK